MFLDYFALFGDEFKNKINLSINIQDILENEKKFGKEVYSNIEYVMENFCVNYIFSNGIQSFRKYYLYENLVVVFLSIAIIKFTLLLYWYSNNFSISKKMQKVIISTIAREFTYNKKGMVKFYEENEAILTPAYLLMLLK